MCDKSVLRAGADQLFAARMNQKAPSDNGICDSQSTIFSGKGVFMRLKSIVYNICNRLHRKTLVLNDRLHRSESPLTPDLPPSAKRKPNAAPAGGRSPVDFDLVEAVHLRALGWSYRRIARRMNNVSRETVRARILDYEAQFRVAPPEPLQQSPIVPVQQSAPVCKAPVALPVAPQPAPVPAVPVVAPPTPFALESVPAGTKAFFLVNGEQNVILAHNCAQMAVGIERWHPSFAMLPAFRDADRFWVVLNSDDDNAAFFRSIVGDIWIRERCAISRGDSRITEVRWTWVQQVCKYRLMVQRANAGLREEWWRQQFEAPYFAPMPQPNHAARIEELLAPPKKEEPARPFSFGGSIEAWRNGGTGWYG